jgi:hypothetical protein
MYTIRNIVLLISGACILASCQDQEAPVVTRNEAQQQLMIEVLSSSPDRVTGGDVLLGFSSTTNIQPETLSLSVNGQSRQALVAQVRNGRVEVLIDGLQIGTNELTARLTDSSAEASIQLTNYPITGPVFSGPQQYPFVCSSVLEWGVQPLVDHQEAWGFPVLDAAGAVVGYSKDCSVEPFVEYHYMSAEGYKPMPEDGSRPQDIQTTVLTDGREVDFIVRWERGTINRFLYSIAALAAPGEIAARPGTENWNGRLLFHFEGGVGVGHFQGRMNANRARLAEAIGQGYAVVYSTGNRTGVHYNLQVGGETALMLKERFIKRYGEPLYTVAIGGSGGAIQQYVYAQNHPGLIDAGVPQYGYPDMVTQTIHVGDCELLEHYMDVTDRDNPKWQVTQNRSLLVGFNATDAVPDPLAGIKRQLGYASAPGTSECVPAWRGLTPLSMNPHYGQAREQEKMFPADLMASVQWTHYDDLRNIYGTDDQGDPRVPWDNVGVQYGLQAMLNGDISQEEFLDLNAKIGGWKHPREMVQEGSPFLGEPSPETFDPWSSRNMNLATGNEPAPRTTGDLEAIRALYTSGMVFDGQLDIPFIDWRHYLEEELDMHNSHQSFSARQRILNKMGHADNQLIWFTDARPESAFDQTPQALDVLHDWMMNIREHPERSIAQNRPSHAVDSCFNTDGTLLASGNDVWNGILNDREVGACTQAFPIYRTSRIVAGSPIEGSIFKCSLKPVDVALADGTYGTWAPDSAQSAQLRQIFPEGVCDYSQPDQGRPR